MSRCPCGNEIEYLKCCGRYHRGEEAPDPLSLMRSRYAAYAVGNADYILRTERRESPLPKPKRRKEILAFCKGTRFEKLEILETKGNTVTFRATLSQKGKDVSFTECSLFEQVEGKWVYLGPI